jgi:hypothetical protein
VIQFDPLNPREPFAISSVLQKGMAAMGEPKMRGPTTASLLLLASASIS